MVDKKLLEVKQRLKAVKPVFIRHDAHKKKRVGQKWRKPKGRQNKMRLNKRGYKMGLRAGYASPKLLRGCFHKDGREIVTISSLKQLEQVDGSKHIIVLARCGTKNKYAIVKAALEKKFDIINLEDSSRFIKSVEDIMKLRKDGRQAIENERKKKKEKKPKKPVEEKVADTKEEKTDKEKQMEAKKEKDKILISKKEQY